MQALERALRTGTVLLAAAQADALWAVGCGDAIEDAKQAINRYSSTNPAGFGSGSNQVAVQCVQSHVFCCVRLECMYVLTQYALYGCSLIATYAAFFMSGKSITQVTFSCLCAGFVHGSNMLLALIMTMALYMQVASLEFCAGSQRCHACPVCPSAAAQHHTEEHQPVGLSAGRSCSHCHHVRVPSGISGQCSRPRNSTSSSGMLIPPCMNRGSSDPNRVVLLPIVFVFLTDNVYRHGKLWLEL